MQLVDQFSKIKVLVIGDVMLDRYLWGRVDRISPEAPVPVIQLERKSDVVGGAANVAANIHGLGATAFLVGLVGDDADGDAFCKLLDGLDIASSHLIRVENRPTTVKTRIIAHNQHVTRIDQEIKSEMDAQGQKLALEKISSVLESVDIVVISDYAKGMVSEYLLEEIIDRAKRLGKKVLVDPKGKSFAKYHGATIITPNRREAAEASDMVLLDQQSVETAGNHLLAAIGCEAVLITQSEDGMSLIQPENSLKHFPTTSLEIGDVTGAGDTVIATLAVAFAAGLGFEQSANLANIAAGFVVKQVGTTTISAAELEKCLR